MFGPSLNNYLSSEKGIDLDRSILIPLVPKTQSTLSSVVKQLFDCYRSSDPVVIYRALFATKVFSQVSSKFKEAASLSLVNNLRALSNYRAPPHPVFGSFLISKIRLMSADNIRLMFESENPKTRGKEESSENRNLQNNDFNQKKEELIVNAAKVKEPVNGIEEKPFPRAPSENKSKDIYSDLRSMVLDKSERGSKDGSSSSIQGPKRFLGSLNKKNNFKNLVSDSFITNVENSPTLEKKLTEDLKPLETEENNLKAEEVNPNYGIERDKLFSDSNKISYEIERILSNRASMGLSKIEENKVRTVCEDYFFEARSFILNVEKREELRFKIKFCSFLYLFLENVVKKLKIFKGTKEDFEIYLIEEPVWKEIFNCLEKGVSNLGLKKEVGKLKMLKKKLDSELNNY